MSSSYVSESSDLVSMFNTKSAVWKSRQTKTESQKDEDVAICRFCHMSVVAKGGNTSNFLMHLKNHHLMKHLNVRKLNESKTVKGDCSKQSTSKVSVGQTTLSNIMVQKYDRKSKKWQQLTDQVIYCIAKDMMPIYSIAKVGFRQLHSSFDP